MWCYFILINGVVVFSIGLIKCFYDINERIDDLEERMIFN